MRELPILFSSESVLRLRDGSQTMTRRIVKPQPRFAPNGAWHWNRPDRRTIVGSRASVVSVGCGRKVPVGKTLVGYAPYAVGDHLWVREALARDDDDLVVYAADEIMPTEFCANAAGNVPIRWSWKTNYLTARFMPKKFARLWLEVTGVKCERVQDITPEECECEGIIGTTLPSPVNGQPYKEYLNGDSLVYITPRDAFAALWDRVNGKGAWKRNDWVSVYTFTKIKTTWRVLRLRRR